MASVFSENLRIHNAEQFKQSIIDVNYPNLYLTIGKATPWSNDSSPPTPNTSINTFYEVWNNMMGAKLITGNDVRHVIPRNNWTSGTVYNTYDHTIDSSALFLPSYKFYVVTTDWNVYKCLSNNNGAPSTVMPTQTKTDGVVKESDNYIWKYMYTVTAEERLRFVTAGYIPVRTLVTDNSSLQWQVQNNAKKGAIEAIKVVSGGSNYRNASTISINITGDGSGAQAVASTNTVSNTINQITVTNPGSGYTYATVSISDATGSGASALTSIPPRGGHGTDPVRELGGSYIMINPRIVNSEGGKITTDNEFRQIAIVADPYIYGTKTTASGSVYNQTTKLTLSTGSSIYYEDEVVYQGGSLSAASFKGTIAAWDSANSIVWLINTEGTPTADVLIGANSAATRYVESITNKELETYTGNLLYIDNIAPIQRAADQTEDFKIIIKF